MNIKSILTAGPVGILTAGGGVMWAQHELHYLLRPSVIETLAGIATVGGGMVWAANKSKGKRPAPVAERSAEEVVTTSAPPISALPCGTSGDPVEAAYQRLVAEARTR